MHGRNNPSFFPTKNNPAPSGNEEGQMIPEASDCVMYFSIASVSGWDRKNNRPLEMLEPGMRSMAVEKL